METDFASEQEIQDTINDQMNNPVGFQERVANWAAEKYKKYFIVINFWLLIWGIFIQPYLQENLGLPAMTYVESNVKELPEKGAKIVAQLKENIEATIIENRRGWWPEGRLCCKEKFENYKRARSRRNGGKVTSRRVIKRSSIVFSLSLTVIPKTGKYLKKSQDFLLLEGQGIFLSVSEKSVYHLFPTG